MMIGRVSSSAVSDLHSACWLACLARPLIGVKERRTAGPTARGRRTAPHQAQASPGLGRPGGAGRADPAPAQKAAGAPAGHAGHRPAVAPPPGQKEMDLPQPHRTTARQHRDRRADRAASFALPGPITRWLTCPSSGSDVGPSLAASSTNTCGSPKSSAQDQRQSFGTPHAAVTLPVAPGRISALVAVTVCVASTGGAGFPIAMAGIASPATVMPATADAAMIADFISWRSHAYAN